jgi:hypothetical protein
MANLTKGTKKAGEVAEENRSSAFYRVKTLIMKDGEGPWYVRVITPFHEMTSADTHMFCDTKPKPEEYKGNNWQKSMFAICQNDRMFVILDENENPTGVYEDGYGDCYIHNRDRGKKREGKFPRDKSLPDWQTYALAVVREPVTDSGTGRIRGYRDAEEEFKQEDGTVKRIPRFVIISQKHRNFWSGLEAALFDGGSLAARDVRITRKENDYAFAVGDPDPVLYPGSAAWARYTDALELTGYDLDEEILRWASADWYKRWFIEGAIPEGGYGSGEDEHEGTAADSAADAGATRPDPAAVDEFASRLQAARSGGTSS